MTVTTRGRGKTSYQGLTVRAEPYRVAGGLLEAAAVRAQLLHRARAEGIARRNHHGHVVLQQPVRHLRAETKRRRRGQISRTFGAFYTHVTDPETGLRGVSRTLLPLPAQEDPCKQTELKSRS
eukprot:1195522-Prorocentrum_minimum.AAC.6